MQQRIARAGMILTAAVLAACTPVAPGSEADAPAFVRAPDDGHCYAAEPIPAVYEQVPGQVQVIQAEIAPDGTVIRPPIYRNATVPKLVRERSETRFKAPCPDQITPSFISSLQRALLARGYYSGEVTGSWTGGTRAALRRYQAERGLDSEQVSLDTARELGLSAVDLPES